MEEIQGKKGDPHHHQNHPNKCACQLVSFPKFFGDTPWKINMEHINHPFRKENDLNQTSMIMFQPLIFQGVKIKQLWETTHRPTWIFTCFPWSWPSWLEFDSHDQWTQGRWQTPPGSCLVVLHELKLGNETWKHTAFLPSLKLTAKAPKLELEWMVGVLICFWVKRPIFGCFCCQFQGGYYSTNQ